MTERIEFIFHNWKPNEDQSVYNSIQEIFEQSGISHLSSNVYTITKDLILNGIKANYKRIFFHTNSMDIHHPSDYELGVRMFKSKVLHGSLPDFESLAEEMDLWVKLEISSNTESFNIRITNNQSMVDQEIGKIRNSFFHANHYEDIMEYYLERADDSEGEGIGIALVIIILKDLNIPLSNFSIRNLNGYTTAEIAFPWERLRSIKKKIKKMLI